MKKYLAGLCFSHGSGHSAPPRLHHPGPPFLVPVPLPMFLVAWGRHGGSPWDNMNSPCICSRGLYALLPAEPALYCARTCQNTELLLIDAYGLPLLGSELFVCWLGSLSWLLGRVWYIIESWTHVIHTYRCNTHIPNFSSLVFATCILFLSKWPSERKGTAM